MSLREPWLTENRALGTRKLLTTFLLSLANPESIRPASRSRTQYGIQAGLEPRTSREQPNPPNPACHTGLESPQKSKNPWSVNRGLALFEGMAPLYGRKSEPVLYFAFERNGVRIGLELGSIYYSLGDRREVRKPFPISEFLLPASRAAC